MTSQSLLNVFFFSFLRRLNISLVILQSRQDEDGGAADAAAAGPSPAPAGAGAGLRLRLRLLVRAHPAGVLQQRLLRPRHLNRLQAAAAAAAAAASISSPSAAAARPRGRRGPDEPGRRRRGQGRTQRRRLRVRPGGVHLGAAGTQTGSGQGFFLVCVPKRVEITFKELGNLKIVYYHGEFWN